MKLDNLHNIYFLGIGGIGMSALARYFHFKGVNVSGYDKTSTSLTRQLEAEGISVHYEENIDLLPHNIDLVIYTPAIPITNIEYQHLKSTKLLMKRSEVLGGLTKDKFTIAVAGTHGKTSITSIIAHILKFSGYKITALIGGITKNYNSNLIISDKSEESNKSEELIIVEADEYDKSFLTLNPDISIITAMDADHLDIYKTKENLHSNFIQFARQLKGNGKLFINAALSNQFSLLLASHSPLTITYSLLPESAAHAENIRIENFRYFFDIVYKERSVKNIHYNVPGKYNIENAIAASAVALEIGVKVDNIKDALETYKGVVRRFDYRINTEDVVYIDDYAHHPEELKACILAVKDLYKERKITGIFQPHLYSRTKDLAFEFAKVLELLDELILLDIYPARELPVEGVSSEIIFNQVNIKKKILCSKNDVLDILKNYNIEILLTLGAGDIDTLVEPIEELLNIRIFET